MRKDIHTKIIPFICHEGPTGGKGLQCFYLRSQMSHIFDKSNALVLINLRHQPIVEDTNLPGGCKQEVSCTANTRLKGNL